jgi:hypothetical protein
VEVTPKGAQRSGAPRRCAVDGTSTALHSKTRATARRRSAGLPPRNVLDYWWGVPPVDVGAGAGTPGEDMLLVVIYPWPVYGGPLGLNFANLGSGEMLMTSTQVFRIEPL